MRPLQAAVALFVIVFVGSLYCYGLAIGGPPQGAGFAWYAWRAAGAGCLSSTAVELVVFVAWLWQKCRRTAGNGGVPLRLTAADRVELLAARPAVAMLMPAHNEASNPGDREGLVSRIFDILMRTPAYSTFFLLADSPASQRDNELGVVAEVQRRLRESGHSHWQSRIVMEEYRDKPLSWRHKCGSLLRWIERFGDRYEFMFILDADSSLGVQDPRRPQTCDVLERMIVAMRRDANLALVQATIEIVNHQSCWGWIQAVNTRMGASYYMRVFAYLYGRSAPCYGHNCLMRVLDFATHATNTLSYTSHDHVDSSDLAAAGLGCVLSDAVVTFEQPEDSVPSWLTRECRWSRGNGQWLVYLLKKRGLPLEPAVYLTLGILQYVWALLATIFLVAAAVLMHQGHVLVSPPDCAAARVLGGIVLFALLVPKLIASPTLLQFLASMTASMVIGPAVMVLQGFYFVLGAFGSGWVPRGARANDFDLAQIVRVYSTFLPVVLLGLALHALLHGAARPQHGGMLVHLTVISMVASPIVALVLSWPKPKPRQA